MSLKVRRPDYGVEAPVVFVGALAVALVSMLVWTTSPPNRRLAQAFGMTATLVASAIWIYSKILRVHLLRPRILRAARIPEGGRVLDLGARRGLLAVGAARMSAGVRSIAIAPFEANPLVSGTREMAEENADREDVAERVSVEDGDLRLLPYDDNSFDAVVACHLATQVRKPEDRAKVYAEARRVLRPRGRLVVADSALSRHAPGLAKAGFQNISTDWGALAVSGIALIEIAEKPTS